MIALIADIHGNLEALQAVLKDIKKQGITKVYCLGDYIDYGAKPEEVVVLTKEFPAVLGNHDAALFNTEVLKWFNDTAIESSKFSRKSLSKESKDFIKNLPLKLETKEFYMVHALPPESFEDYITECKKTQLAEAFSSFSQRVCFVGHTHVFGTYVLTPRKQIKKLSLTRSCKLQPRYKYIINVGSVGQPRDGDNRAGYLLFNTKTDCVKVRRVKYNIKRTQERILQAGLDEENAIRLD